MDRPDLIVVGDVMADVTVSSGQLALGGDVQGEVRIRPGGAGANAAVWAASTGVRVALCGRVGQDLMGRLLRSALAARGVEAILGVDPLARTGAMLVVRQGGERSIVADRGANAELSPEDLPKRLAAEAVLVSGYLLFHPGSEPAAIAALARSDAPFVAVDAASWPLLEAYGRDRFFDATREATVLLANAKEAETLAMLPAIEAARSLAERYPIACVKLGSDGAVLASHGRLLSAGALPVEPVDATGAGDAFDGVLLAELARSTDLEGALDAACAAGARAAASSDTWPPEEGRPP